MKSKIIDLNQKLKSNKLTAKKLIKSSLRSCKKFKKTNFLINVNNVESLRLAKHLYNEETLSKSFLACIPYVLKDNISTKNIITTGGSKFLENYVPPYDATVYSLLKKTNAILDFGSCQYNLDKKELVDKQGRIIHITPVEQSMLSLLGQKSGQIFSRDKLAELLGAGQGLRSIDVQVTRLRKKIEKDSKNPRYLQTVRGKGYILLTE